MIKVWTEEAWDDYLWWQEQDRKTLRRINRLVKEIERDPFDGIGKPEPLRDDLSEAWSRRIDAGNRIVYTVIDDTVTFYSMKDHYGDK